MRQSCLVVLLLVIAAFSLAHSEDAGASMSSREKEVLLQEAADYFSKGNDARLRKPAVAKEYYTKALLRYERLVGEGVSNGRLFYNIGNTYFRLDDIGRAILNYRRAELFIPAQQELQQSLQFVLSKRLDTIEEKSKKKVLKTLFFWHYDISARIKLILFGVLYCCLFVLWCLKWLQLIRISNWWLSVTFILSVLLLGSYLIERDDRMHNRMGVVLSQEVTARKGDGETYLPSFAKPLHAGTEYRLKEKRGDWQHIELMDGNRCWIKTRSGALVIDDSF